jgi:hypothetical protein
MEFDSNGATAETIREEDSYSGIRVTLGGTLSRVVIRFHVDVNVGDPIWPGPQQISVPRLIEGVIVVRGYPLEMVLAEKIVTALERGTVNTRWRDFVDIYVLTGRFAIKAQALKASLQRVAQFRNAELAPDGGRSVVLFKDFGVMGIEPDDEGAVFITGLNHMGFNFGVVGLLARTATGKWSLRELAHLPSEGTELSVISPGLYAVWSGSRVVVFNNRQILGLAICRDTTPDPVQ